MLKRYKGELPLKDQPIDSVEFERLWEEIGMLWKEIEWRDYEDVDPNDTIQLHRRLKEIKHRFFNQLVS